MADYVTKTVTLSKESNRILEEMSSKYDDGNEQRTIARALKLYEWLMIDSDTGSLFEQQRDGSMIKLSLIH